MAEDIVRKLVLAGVLVGLSVHPLAAQRGATQRTPATGPAAFAVLVTDPGGAPLTDVQVTVTGRVQRSGSTESGRIAFEDLPVGQYHFKFEKDGYDTVEQDAAGKRGAPVDVKVTMTPKPKPVEPPPPAPEPKPAVNAKPVVLDMPAFIEKYYVGKASGKTTPMACSDGGSATLIQANDAIAEHTHADADEYIYVIAGEGSARLGERSEPLSAGVFLMIPRGAAHAFTVGRKHPLVLVSTLAGGHCS
ncbi:MAG TPA: carboxypeptidase regulatory-like domain-containing protein [Vicinamibacterales bacterium]|nr:carboxypeptidase regulatory-like domain-containing protein [Vicinamibacterales bacterium]